MFANENAFESEASISFFKILLDSELSADSKAVEFEAMSNLHSGLHSVRVLMIVKYFLIPSDCGEDSLDVVLDGALDVVLVISEDF